MKKVYFGIIILVFVFIRIANGAADNKNVYVIPISNITCHLLSCKA